MPFSASLLTAIVGCGSAARSTGCCGVACGCCWRFSALRCVWRAFGVSFRRRVELWAFFWLPLLLPVEVSLSLVRPVLRLFLAAFARWSCLRFSACLRRCLFARGGVCLRLAASRLLACVLLVRGRVFASLVCARCSAAAVCLTALSCSKK